MGRELRRRERTARRTTPRLTCHASSRGRRPAEELRRRGSLLGGAGRPNNLVAAAQLLNRAAALDGARAAQARSDLAAARGFLGGVRPEAPVAKRRAALQERLESLEQRVAAEAGGG